MAAILICILVGAGVTAYAAFRLCVRTLRRWPEGKAARRRFWLLGGAGLLLIAIVFGVGTVIATSQFLHWRALALVASGEAALSINNLDKAIDDCTEAIRIEPSLAVAFNDRGAAWLGKNEYDKAIADCDEALRLKPTLANALANRGQAWVEKGDYEKAVDDCSEAIRQRPNLANAFNNRALAWLGKIEYDKALADCSEALRLNPNHANAFNNRALAWMGKLEYDKALADCSEALRLNPNLACAFTNQDLPGIVRVSMARPLRIGQRHFASNQRMPRHTAAWRGSAPLARTDTFEMAKRPSKLPRKRASSPLGETPTIWPHSRPPMLRQAILTMPSSGCKRRSTLHQEIWRASRALLLRSSKPTNRSGNQTFVTWPIVCGLWPTCRLSKICSR